MCSICGCEAWNEYNIKRYVTDRGMGLYRLRDVVCMFYILFILLYCGCEARMTIWKIEEWGVLSIIGCGQELRGMVKY